MSIKAERSKLYLSNAKVNSTVISATYKYTERQNMKLRVHGAHKVQLEQEMETSASTDNK